MQADAYAGFHHLYGDGAIYEVAFWAHTWRKFHEFHAIHASPTTTEVLARIGALYAIEDEVRGKPADLRLSVRQARARPLLEDLRNWMEKALRSLSVGRAKLQAPFGMRSRDGVPLRGTPTMVCWK